MIFKKTPKECVDVNVDVTSPAWGAALRCERLAMIQEQIEEKCHESRRKSEMALGETEQIDMGHITWDFVGLS